jgi:hypothetical protein
MPHIVLTDEQARIVSSAVSAVELRDEKGTLLGRVPPPNEEEIVARILARRGEARQCYPAAEVEARLRRLQEIADADGMTEAKMWDLLNRMRAGENV